MQSEFRRILSCFLSVQASNRAVKGVFPPFPPFFWGKKTGGVNLFCNDKLGALISNRPFH